MELSGPRLDPAKGGSACSAVLLLHGYGADGNDLIGLAAEWAPALPETLFFSPHAPYPCEASSFGRQWFGFQDKPRHLVAMEVATAAQVIDSSTWTATNISSSRTATLRLTNAPTPMHSMNVEIRIEYAATELPAR